MKYARSPRITKNVSGTVIDIILFCGIDVTNRCFVVGFEHTDKPDNVIYLFNETDKETSLITSWRTMKILEGLEHIDDITIAKCWHLAKHRPSIEWNKFKNKDGSDVFSFIQEIFTALPNEETLREMGSALHYINR